MAVNAKRPGQHQVLVRMPDALFEALRERSEQEERSMAQTIRLVLRHYLGEP